MRRIVSIILCLAVITCASYSFALEFSSSDLDSLNAKVSSEAFGEVFELNTNPSTKYAGETKYIHRSGFASGATYDSQSRIFYAALNWLSEKYGVPAHSSADQSLFRKQTPSLEDAFETQDKTYIRLYDYAEWLIPDGDGYTMIDLLLSGWAEYSSYDCIIAFYSFSKADAEKYQLVASEEQQVAIDESKLESYKVIGNTVTFGSYEQDNNKGNGAEPIEWIVIAIDGEKVLLRSKYVLFAQPFNTDRTSVTWESSSLRTYVNGVFLSTAFTDVEQELIASSVVKADKNPSYPGIGNGRDTLDQIFILSIPEIYNYFPTKAERIVSATPSATTNLIFGPDEKTKGVMYYTRTIGWSNSAISYVEEDGEVQEGGMGVEIKMGVVPALWLDLSVIQ